MAGRTQKRKAKPKGHHYPCPLCSVSPKFCSASSLALHIARMHAPSDSELLAVDALEDMVPGVPEYRKVISHEIKRLEQVQELERMFRLPSSRRKPKTRTAGRR